MDCYTIFAILTAETNAADRHVEVGRLKEIEAR